MADHFHSPVEFAGDAQDPLLGGDDIRRLPVPVLSLAQTKSLAGVHDAHRNTPLLSFAEAAHDPARLALDEAICRILGCDITVVSTIRRLLLAEPLLI